MVYERDISSQMSHQHKSKSLLDYQRKNGNYMVYQFTSDSQESLQRKSGSQVSQQSKGGRKMQTDGFKAQKWKTGGLTMYQWQSDALTGQIAVSWVNKAKTVVKKFNIWSRGRNQIVFKRNIGNQMSQHHKSGSLLDYHSKSDNHMVYKFTSG